MDLLGLRTNARHGRVGRLVEALVFDSTPLRRDPKGIRSVRGPFALGDLKAKAKCFLFDVGRLLAALVLSTKT